MKKRMIRRRPREPSEAAESTKVRKIIYSFWAFLIKRKILPILRARSTVGPLPNSTGIDNTFSKSISKVNATIVKSKMFHESLKYCFLRAMIFIIASTVKMAMKT